MICFIIPHQVIQNNAYRVFTMLHGYTFKKCACFCIALQYPNVDG